MKKRSVRIAGHATSITLEEEFWLELKAIAEKRNLSLNNIIAEIDTEKRSKNLSSAIRIYVLESVKS